MKKRKFYFLFRMYSLFILLLLLGLSACQEKEFTEDLKENFIDLNVAEDLVGELYFKGNEGGDQSTKSVELNLKKVESITSVPDENGNIVYYIMNYESGGFIILAADNRVHPVLAFSANSNFPVESGVNLPNGLVEWLFNKKEEVAEIRRLNRKQTRELKKAWTPTYIQNFINGNDFIKAPEPDPDPIIDPEEPDCPDNTLTIVGPLLNTTWGQGVGYNDFIPVTGCSNYSNGHAPTGCVATAMAQIMRFHEYPNSYDWNSMPFTYGSNATAQLMLDIGNAVGMDWGCDGSSASTEDEVASSFRNDFGYSTASYADYNHTTVQQQLRWNRPVILKGGRNTGWWIFGVYSDGHA